MNGKLNPEGGGGGVESSEVGYEAKANWEIFKGQIDGTTTAVEKDFRAVWEKVKAMVETLIAKLPV